MQTDNKKTIVLQFPFKAKTEGGAEVEVKEITLRRLKVKDLDHMPSMEDGERTAPKKFVPLIAALSGHDIATIGELDFADLGNVATTLVSFYPDSLGTIGGKSSGESR